MGCLFICTNPFEDHTLRKIFAVLPLFLPAENAYQVFKIPIIFAHLLSRRI